MRVESGSVSLRINESVMDISLDNTEVNIDETKKPEDDFSTELRSVQQTGIEKGFKDRGGVREDVMEQASNLEKVNQNLDYLSKAMSLEDAKKAEEEGFDLDDTDVSAFVSVVDEIKIKMAMGGADVDMTGLDEDTINKVVGKGALANKIASKMYENDLPLTDENIKEAGKAAELAGSLTGLTPDAKKYLMANDLEPTIANCYKAEFSGNLSDAPAITEDVWEELSANITSILESNGFAADEANISRAKWLIENDFELDAKNLVKLAGLDNLEFPMSEEEIIDDIINGMKLGKRPKDAVLGEDDIYIRANEAVRVIATANDSQVAGLVNKDLPVTVFNLKYCSYKDSITIEDLSADKQLKAITVKRSMVELSISMTAGAAAKMLRAGINIDTTDMEKLLESLKEQEEKLTGQADFNVSLYEETITVREGVKTLPEYVLGTSFARMEQVTLRALYSEGTALAAKLNEAGEKYESLMTAPRKDMGDSINKAFRNIDDILSDMGLELTKENQKAVRILSYNSTEITEENILKVKLADAKVEAAVNSLTSKTVMEFIKRDINPLDMTMDEITSTAKEVADEDESFEKYSEYLWKLEHNKEISPEERESYIGIYRLLHTVNSTDGAALGALINQNADITLKNLLMAVRSRKHGEMDYTVNDDFGGLSVKETDSTDILTQVMAAFGESGENAANDSERNQYGSRMLENIFKNLSPEAVRLLNADNNIMNLSAEELWQSMHDMDTESESYEYAEVKRNDYIAAGKAEEAVVKQLMAYDLPVTTANLLSMSSIMNGRNTWYKRLFDIANKNYGLSDAKEDIIERMADALETPEEMAKAMEDLADTAENVMKTMVNTTEVSAIDLRGIKLINKELSVMRKMADEESYSIPVLIENSVTGVNLKIVRGSNDRGKVSISMESPFGAKVYGEVIFKESSVKGFISSDDEETLNKLESNKEFFLSRLSKSGTDADITYVRTKQLDLVKNMEKEQTVKNDSEVLTRELYSIAKSFIYYVKDSYK